MKNVVKILIEMKWLIIWLWMIMEECERYLWRVWSLEKYT